MSQTPFDPRAITIVSGGQTGADRAALDFAIEHGIPHGGWCPRGRLAEDGPIPAQYNLQETPTDKYPQRTEWNVRDSDATAIFTLAAFAEGGTLLTFEIAQRLGKPWQHVARDAGLIALGDVAANPAEAPATLPLSAHAARLREFLIKHEVRHLNVAGPRASQEPEIGDFVRGVLAGALLS